MEALLDEGLESTLSVLGIWGLSETTASCESRLLSGLVAGRLFKLLGHKGTCRDTVEARLDCQCVCALLPERQTMTP